MRPFPPQDPNRVSLPRFPGLEGLGSVSLAGPTVALLPEPYAADDPFRPIFAVTVAGICHDPRTCADPTWALAYNRCFSRYAVWINRILPVTDGVTATPPEITFQVRASSFSGAVVIFEGILAAPTYAHTGLIVGQATAVLYQQWELWAMIAPDAPTVQIRCGVDLDRSGSGPATQPGEFVDVTVPAPAPEDP